MSEWVAEDEPQNLATVLSQFFDKDVVKTEVRDDDAAESDTVEENSLQDLVNLVNNEPKWTLHQKNSASNALQFNQSTNNENFNSNNQQKIQLLDQKPFGMARETEEMLNSKLFPLNSYFNKLPDIMQNTQAYNQNTHKVTYNPPVNGRLPSINYNYNLSSGNRSNTGVYNQMNGTQKSNERIFSSCPHYDQPLGNGQNSQAYYQSTFGTAFNPLVNDRVSVASTNFNRPERPNSQIYNQSSLGSAFIPPINEAQKVFNQHPHNHVLYPSMVNQVGSYNQDTFSTMLPPVGVTQALHNERIFLSNPYMYTSGGFVQNMSNYNQNTHQGTPYYPPINEPKPVFHQSKKRVLSPAVTNKMTVGNQFYPLPGLPNVSSNNLNLLNGRISITNPYYLQTPEIMQNKQIYDQWYNPPIKRTKKTFNQSIHSTDVNPGFNITNQGTFHVQSTFESGIHSINGSKEVHNERISNANPFLNQSRGIVQNEQIYNQSNYEAQYNYTSSNGREETFTEWNKFPKATLESNIQDVAANNQNSFEPTVKSVDYSSTSNKDTNIYSSQPSEIIENMQINNQDTSAPTSNPPNYWTHFLEKDSKLNKTTVDNENMFQNNPVQETKVLDNKSYFTSSLNYNQPLPDENGKIQGNFEVYGPNSNAKITDSEKFITPEPNFNESSLDDNKNCEFNYQSSFETIVYPVDYTKPILNEWVSLESPASNQSLRIIDEETLSNSDFLEAMVNTMDEQDEIDNKEFHIQSSGFYKPSKILEKMLIDNQDIAYKRVEENSKETGDDFVSSTSSDSENSIEKGSPISIKSLLKKPPINNLDHWENHCPNCRENTTKISENREFCKNCALVLSIRCKKCKKLYKSYKCALKHVCSSSHENLKKEKIQNKLDNNQRVNFSQPTTISFLQCKYCSFMTLNERGMKIHVTVKHDNFAKLQNKTPSEPEKISEPSPVKETQNSVPGTESTALKLAGLSLPLIDDQSYCEETKDRSECSRNFQANNNNNNNNTLQSVQSKELTKKYKCKYCPYDGNDASKFINHVSDHNLRLEDSIRSYYEA